MCQWWRNFVHSTSIWIRRWVHRIESTFYDKQPGRKGIMWLWSGVSDAQVFSKQYDTVSCGNGQSSHKEATWSLIFGKGVRPYSISFQISNCRLVQWQLARYWKPKPRRNGSYCLAVTFLLFLRGSITSWYVLSFQWLLPCNKTCFKSTRRLWANSQAMSCHRNRLWARPRWWLLLSFEFTTIVIDIFRHHYQPPLYFIFVLFILQLCIHQASLSTNHSTLFKNSIYISFNICAWNPLIHISALQIIFQYFIDTILYNTAMSCLVGSWCYEKFSEAMNRKRLAYFFIPSPISFMIAFLPRRWELIQSGHKSALQWPWTLNVFFPI